MPVLLYAEREGTRTLIGAFPDRDSAAARVEEMEANAERIEDEGGEDWPERLDDTCWPEGSDAVIDDEDGKHYFYIDGRWDEY
jgi:hypothetical protein